MLGTQPGGTNVSRNFNSWNFSIGQFSLISTPLFLSIAEKENLEKIDDDEDSQAYHLEDDEDGDDDYASGGENDANDSSLNETGESKPEGELT